MEDSWGVLFRVASSVTFDHRYKIKDIICTKEFNFRELELI